eukprot:IDg10828t1
MAFQQLWYGILQISVDVKLSHVLRHLITSCMSNFSSTFIHLNTYMYACRPRYRDRLVLDMNFFSVLFGDNASLYKAVLNCVCNQTFTVYNSILKMAGTSDLTGSMSTWIVETLRHLSRE